MSLDKRGLKVLGPVFLTVLSLMAIAAPGASANLGEFLILDDQKPPVEFDLHAKASAEIDLGVALEIPGIALEINCGNLEVIEGLILTGGLAHAKLLFEGCLVYGTKPKLEWHSGCKVFPTAADRTAGENEYHITAEVLLLVLLHFGADGNKTVLAAKPKEAGGLFSKIFFQNCALGSTADVKGGVTLLRHLPGHIAEHLVQEATGSFKLHQLKYGAHNANALGSMWLFLTGLHHGYEWDII